MHIHQNLFTWEMTSSVNCNNLAILIECASRIYPVFLLMWKVHVDHLCVNCIFWPEFWVVTVRKCMVDAAIHSEFNLDKEEKQGINKSLMGNAECKQNKRNTQ